MAGRLRGIHRNEGAIGLLTLAALSAVLTEAVIGGRERLTVAAKNEKDRKNYDRWNKSRTHSDKFFDRQLRYNIMLTPVAMFVEPYKGIARPRASVSNVSPVLASSERVLSMVSSLAVGEWSDAGAKGYKLSGVPRHFLSAAVIAAFRDQPDTTGNAGRQVGRQ